MSISDAYVRVMCDTCYGEEEVELTALAQWAYDKRNIPGWLKSNGWVDLGDGNHRCDSCEADKQEDGE